MLNCEVRGARQHKAIDLQVLTLVLQHAGRVTPLIRAIIGQSIPLVEAILASGADADQITEKGTTALTAAAQLDDEV